MTTAEKRARKKQNHKFGEKAIARREARAKAHSERIAASAARKAAEEEEVDSFFGGPRLPLPSREAMETVKAAKQKAEAEDE